QIFTYFDGFGWFSGPTDGASHPIYPDESYVIRAPSSDGFEVALSGSVNVSDFRLALNLVEEGSTQDIRLTSSLPVPAELGSLFGADGVSDGDKVLFISNSEAGVDKAASLIATYFDGFGWFSGPTDLNDHLVQPGQGLIYRKSGSNPSISVATISSPVVTN
ncbi:MAG: hypothetical protein ACLFTU_03320, partial [Puniceicoccaceae bacterium]